jgi:septal ring factor EnvC (AmiA/AmiB activator)
MENQLREKLYDERFARDKERIERHEEHMKEQDEQIRKVQDLTIEMGEMIKRHDERIADQGARIKAMETKPGKRWDMVIDKIVNAVVAACVAWMMTKGA